MGEVGADPSLRRSGRRSSGLRGSSNQSSAWGGARAGVKVAGEHGSPRVASTARAMAESTTTATTLRRPPQGLGDLPRAAKRVAAGDRAADPSRLGAGVRRQDHASRRARSPHGSSREPDRVLARAARALGRAAARAAEPEPRGDGHDAYARPRHVPPQERGCSALRYARVAAEGIGAATSRRRAEARDITDRSNRDTSSRASARRPTPSSRASSSRP